MHSIRSASSLRSRLLWRWGTAIVSVLLYQAGQAEPETPTGFSVRTWDTDNGLPCDQITALARTPDGYLWIGTVAGLVRFDGLRFVLLTTNQLPALKTNSIAGLAVEQSSGVLWVADSAGCLARRREGRFELAGISLPAGSARVTSLVGQRDGTLWVATEGQGVFQLAPAQQHINSATNGLPSGFVTQLLCDSRQRIWAIAGEKIVRFENGSWHAPPGAGNLEFPVTALAEGLEGGVWAATVSGYPIHNRGGRVFKIKDDGPATELGTYPWAQDSHRMRITTLWEDRQGRVWVGTYGGGVFDWQSGANWQRLTTEGPLAQLIVSAMIEDEDGSLWVGTQRGGLHRVSKRKVTAIRLPGAAAENFILTACASHDGSVWVGTDGAGIFRYRDGRFEQQTNGLESLQVGVLFEDRRTNLWAGTWAGLYRWNGGRFEPVPGPAAFQAVVLALTEDSKGNLWVCTGDGLVRLRDGEAKVFGNSEGIQHFYLRAVVEDSQGRICVASMDRGLYRQTGARFEEIGAGKWSGATVIRALLADAGGALWIATYGDGLFRLKDGQFRHWTTADGLPDVMLHSIIEDSDANLWLSSDNGIFGYPKRMLEEYRQGSDRPMLCWHLTTADGLETKVCSGAGQPVAARAADGRLWFPNQRSLAVFDPHRVPAGTRMWPALVEEVLVDGLPRLPNASQLLTASSGARRLEIHYTSPNLSAPERLQFRHRLARLEEDWVEAGDRRVVFYNHLPPGSYEFQVMAGGPDGRWHESPGILKLEIIPRWWERRSTQAAAALLLVAAVAGIVWTVARARLRRRLQRLEMQETLENERRRIARDLHDDIGTGLTEVVMLTEPTEQESDTFDALRGQMDLAARKAKQIISDMKLVVWTVNPENDLLPNLADFLANYAQEFLESTPIHCRLDLPRDLPALPVSAPVRHELLLTVKEALNNAVRHSRATELWFRLRVENGELILAVEDNGCGFEAGARAGGGNGLGNMRRRLQSIGGACVISSNSGAGTSVQFRLGLADSDRVGVDSEF